jgi:hypothetical protein
MATRHCKKANGSSTAKRDKRFKQLLALAAEGDETAVHDLWLEYQFDYEKNGGSHV